jgi:hypothetical protein
MHVLTAMHLDELLAGVGPFVCMYAISVKFIPLSKSFVVSHASDQLITLMSREHNRYIYMMYILNLIYQS